MTRPFVLLLSFVLLVACSPQIVVIERVITATPAQASAAAEPTPTLRTSNTPRPAVTPAVRTPQPFVAPTIPSGDALASPCIAWQDAGAHINESTCVRGVVANTNKSGSTFFIDFDNSRQSFYGVSFKHTWDGLKGQCVEISGKLESYRSRPQIVLENKSQLTFCK